MKTYKLINIAPGVVSNFASELENGVPTNSFVNMETNTEYLKWIALGNTPQSANT